MTLKLVDEDGKPIEIPKTLESGEEFNVDGADTKGQPDQPGEDGKYDVTFRGNTSLRINIKGYLKTFPSVKITEKDQVVTITLKKPRTFHYYLTVQAPEGKPELQNPVVKVYSRNDTKMETPLELKGDGYYEMIEDVGLKVVVTSDNYKDKTWVVSVKDDDDIDIHKTETGFTLTDLASFEFDLSKLKKEVDGMTEGTEPGQFAEGTKAEIQPAIDEAEALLTKEGAKKTEYNSAIKNIQTLIKTAYDEKEVPEKAEVKVIAYTQPGAAAKEMTLNVTPLTGAVADTYQKNRTLGLKNRVTLLDVMVAAHRELYPDFDETNITEDESGTKQYKYFDEGVNGQIGTTTGMMFGNQKKVFRSAYIIDGQKNTKVNGDVASITIKDGDTVTLLSCYYSDPGTALVRFTEPRVTAVAGEKFTLTMEGLIYSDVSFDLNTYPTDWEKMSDVVVTLKNKRTGEKFSSVEPSSSNGKMIFNIDEPGIYELDSISSDTYTYFFYPEVRVKVYKRPDAPGVQDQYR